MSLLWKVAVRSCCKKAVSMERVSAWKFFVCDRWERGSVYIQFVSSSFHRKSFKNDKHKLGLQNTHNNSSSMHNVWFVVLQLHSSYKPPDISSCSTWNTYLQNSNLKLPLKHFCLINWSRFTDRELYCSKPTLFWQSEIFEIISRSRGKNKFDQKISRRSLDNCFSSVVLYRHQFYQHTSFSTFESFS